MILESLRDVDVIGARYLTVVRRHDSGIGMDDVLPRGEPREYVGEDGEGTPCSCWCRRCPASRAPCVGVGVDGVPQSPCTPETVSERLQMRRCSRQQT